MKLSLVRVCLNLDGTAVYWAKHKDQEDYQPEPIDPKIALHAITKHGVPIELVCSDPHNYETLFSKPDGATSTTFTLVRI